MKQRGTAPSLFAAAFRNDAQAILAAIAAGADPNAPHPSSNTIPLQLACQSNAIEAIEVLIENGANADQLITRKSRVSGRVMIGHTPLMYAKSVAAAQRLIKAGAKLEHGDERGATALAWAVRDGNAALVHYYLELGARPDIHFEHDGRNMSLLHFISCQLEQLSESSRRDESEVQSRMEQLSEIRKLIARTLV